MFRFSNSLLRGIGLTVIGVMLPSGALADEVIRIMAANTTSGNFQSYDPGEGIRIFQGLDPDIVLIQEFNFGDDSPADIRDFVDEAFGTDFEYFREGGNEQIPNGVISRFPIIQSGEWIDDEVSNRDFAWARIDLPGDRDLWSVSVHFLTTSGSKRNAQANALVDFVQAQVPAGDYLVIAGDFNTNSFSESALNTLSTVVDVSGRPDDQFGDTGTNASRSKPYDQILPGADLNAIEVPVTISGHSFSYSEGLVFDSRVFTPLSAVSPVRRADSGASGMQHMAVIRDFRIATASGTEPVAYPGAFSGTSGTSSISLSWDDVTSSPVPDGYLVKASDQPVIARPVDGLPESNDGDLSDGSAQVNIVAGSEAALFSGLPDDTTYYFEVFPYIDSGSINYKTDGDVPSISVATLPAQGSVPSAPLLGSVYYPYAEGFTVTWNEVVGASGYQIDVATTPTFEGGGGGVLLSEDFDASDSVPGNWENDGTANDSVASHYSSPGNCRAFGTGDSLVTPAVSSPGLLEFYVDSSNGGNGNDGRVSYSIGNGPWVTLADFTVSTAGDVESIDLTNSPDLSAATDVRFRFESTFFTWYLDDVVVTAAATPSLVPGYDGLAVGNTTHHSVVGLDPATTFYFRVRAENDNGEGPDSSVGNQMTTATGTAFSVWADGFGISPADLTTNFDFDQFTDYEEFLFATDPTFAGPGSGLVDVVSVSDQPVFRMRRSIVPGLTTSFLGGSDLPLNGPPLIEGPGVRQYRILSVERFGDYEILNVEVNTGSDPRFFFQMQLTP